MQRIKQGDEVIVRTGKDKGKSGRVSKVLKDNKVLVEGINQVKKNQKPNPNAGVSGGIVVKDMPINISNIGLYNPATKKADRVGFKFLEDGKKVRYFKSTNEVVDV
ncbi:50S ribosomal protein L24 [Methylobacter sp. Wu8]|jgi:large subunit ribosomal protein L24|uniref:Large ribosomal subunit protein uL24 n=1 Tax=Methylobacter tundripaludum TaxID=173365 RepID=A0A2S6H5G2_9GAMM|nr:50S ribosomal protein L24 [Methylobacter tundripaludum]MCF7971209.1 50S ribosomal protein L24 [Methylococcaceae bacterium]MCK9395081.1 50S ribosomal protein L24 [Methylobacter sp.]MCK9636106.1 50S ribosomal protein L24 [Methylobacter tundripaludum]PPK72725.1 LSU ribosomal protein L24P [Methylobacter tundripaludum]